MTGQSLQLFPLDGSFVLTSALQRLKVYNLFHCLDWCASLNGSVENHNICGKNTGLGEQRSFRLLLKKKKKTHLCVLHLMTHVSGRPDQRRKETEGPASGKLCGTEGGHRQIPPSVH